MNEKDQRKETGLRVRGSSVYTLLSGGRRCELGSRSCETNMDDLLVTCGSGIQEVFEL